MDGRSFAKPICVSIPKTTLIKAAPSIIIESGAGRGGDTDSLIRANYTMYTQCPKQNKNKQGGLPRLVRLLRSHEAQVCGGAAGTIQNLSREEKSRTLLLGSLGVIEPLADLLVGRHIKSQVGEWVSKDDRLAGPVGRSEIIYRCQTAVDSRWLRRPEGAGLFKTWTTQTIFCFFVCWYGVVCSTIGAKVNNNNSIYHLPD